MAGLALTFLPQGFQLFCWTLNKHRLKLAAWLHITVASLADLSHFRRVSCDILREAGGVEDSPECLAIRL